MAKNTALKTNMREKIKEILQKAPNGKEDFRIEVAEDSTPMHQHFIIISDYFKKFGQIDRQEFVWQTLRKEIPDSELMSVTMILTFTKDEAKEILGN